LCRCRRRHCGRDRDRRLERVFLTSTIAESPESRSSKTAVVGELSLQPKCLIIVVPNPLVIPGDLFDTSTTGDDGGGQIVRLNATLDLASRENASKQGTFAWSRSTCEWAARVHTRLVCNSVPAPIVGDAEIDLAWIDVARPQELQGLVNLFQVCVRPNLVAECWNIGIPRTVKVVRQHVKPIDVRLNGFRVHGLQVLVLGRKGNGYSVDVAQTLSKFRHESDEVLSIDGWVAAPAFSARPLPVDVHATELPFGQEPSKRFDKRMPVLLCAGHLRPSLSSGSRVAELPATDTKVLGYTVRSSHKIVVHSFLVGVHLANLVCLRVDSGKGENKVRESGGIKVLWELLVTRCTARVPVWCQWVVMIKGHRRHTRLHGTQHGVKQYRYRYRKSVVQCLHSCQSCSDKASTDQ
jgi:hypothetical protein